MRLVALCPTFRHPTLLASSLAMWLTQDCPLDNRTLIICDDGGTFPPQAGEGWGLVSMPERFPSLSAKYNYMVSIAPPDTDAFLVWEDDDTYFPDYVSRYAAELEQHDLVKLSWVLSDYTIPEGRLLKEGATGRFHSSLAFHKQLLARVGGWPATKRADFDQQLLGQLNLLATSPGDPHREDLPIPYVYGWHTGHAHCQSTMRSPDDETWWDRGEQAYAQVAPVDKLVPEFDGRTRRIFQLAKRELPCLSVPTAT